MAESVFIVTMGACTPVGCDAWSSAAAVRAGINGFCQHPYMIDTVGGPMRVAIAPSIGIEVGGADRLEALLFPAIDEALEPIASAHASLFNMAIALGLPSPRPGLPDDLQRQMMSRIRSRYARYFGTAATFPAGHASGLFALQAVNAKLRQGTLDAGIVAGVDSYIEPLTLEWLESCGQLHGVGPLNNAWGFIPGEAGAALLLMRESVAEACGLKPLAMVLGTGTAMEPKRIKTETVCIGEGLTQAFRAALAALPAGARVTDVYCDMNGEPYRADEYGFSCLRTKEWFEAASEFIAPADCWGDVSSAGAVLHLILASAAGQKGYAKGSLAFAWASAEMGERAAALVATGGRA